MEAGFNGLDYKGFPLDARVSRAELAPLAWDVSRGETATPAATLSRTAIERNAAAMGEWCKQRGVSLAPHGKTTLSPELVRLQLDHGAWAITAASPRQTGLIWNMGAKRVLLANEVTDPAAVRWLVHRLAENPSLALHVYVDSIAGARLLTTALHGSGASALLDVLVELGHPQGRSGARTVREAEAIAQAVSSSPNLRLAGVAGYEGTLGSAREPHVLQGVDAFLADLGHLARRIAHLFEVPDPVISAGGSLFFDRVVSMLALTAGETSSRLVLRSGCYLIHDHGLYLRQSPAAHKVPDVPALEPALSVWGRVISAPEPGLVLIDAGRRDVSHDAGLPMPLERFRDGTGLDLLASGALVTALSDQHAFVAVRSGSDVRIGDLVRLGVSHPCTTLDRWRALFVIDDLHRVVDVVTTQF